MGSSDGGVSVYGFVVFCVLLVIGISMLSNVLGSSGVDLNSNSTPNDTGFAGAVKNVAHGVQGGYSMAILGIGILGAVMILRALGYF